jgi:hypothetical protein
MPVHDWTRVDAGIFHDFHSSWITHLKEALNGGMLPEGYYALSEQHAGVRIADVLTLHSGAAPHPNGPQTVLVKERPPKAMRKLVLAPAEMMRAKRRTLTIRHVSNHRIVALVEIFSPANKVHEKSVSDVRDKAYDAIKQGIHMLAVDLFPPGPHAPHGLAGAVWEDFGEVEDFPPADKPLTLGSYIGGRDAEGYLDAIAVGDPLPAKELFLDIDGYVDAPLEETYQLAYRGVPAYWRDVLEGRNPQG